MNLIVRQAFSMKNIFFRKDGSKTEGFQTDSVCGHLSLGHKSRAGIHFLKKQGDISIRLLTEADFPLMLKWLTNEEAKAVGRVRNDEGADECMGGSAGAAPEGGDVHHAVADAAVYVTDKVPLIGTVMGIGSGRRTAVWAWRQFREVRRGHGGEDLIVIKMFGIPS